jgi:hypothetical protein
LEKDPANRLGSKNGVEEILSHPFLQSIEFDKLVNKELEAPFKPKLSEDLMDVSNFDGQFTSEEVTNSVIPISKMEQIKKHKNQFDDFS